MNDVPKLFCIRLGEMVAWYDNDTQTENKKCVAKALILTVKNNVEEAEQYALQAIRERTRNEFWEVIYSQCINTVGMEDNFEFNEDANYKLCCVKVFKTNEEHNEMIDDDAVIWMVSDTIENAQQAAIRHMQQRTGDNNWSVAEGQEVELVEGWLIRPIIDKHNEQWNITLISSPVL